MVTRSQRYREHAEQVDSEEAYRLDEAVDMVLSMSTANFTESVECHIRLEIDPADASQQIRDTLVLPNGTGQEVRVIVFAKGEKKQEAEEAGADAVGNDDLIEKIENGWMEFDQAVATPDMMSDVSALGPLLGPRNLMPNNKAGTVTFDIEDAVEKLKKGQVELRNDDYGIIHCVVGTDDMTNDELRENLRSVFDFIEDHRPPGIEQSQFVQSINLTPTMGPSVSVDTAEVFSE